MRGEAELIHLNGNILCAVDGEMSGLVPGYHDLIEIAICPLDANYEPSQRVVPFSTLMRMKRPQNLDKRALKVNGIREETLMLEGLDPWQAVTLFEDWFARLKLMPGKRIMLLGHNLSIDADFMKDWLGYRSFSYMFDSRIRDTMVLATALNDRADLCAEEFPFNKVTLQWLCKKLEVPRERRHRALEDAVATAQCWKKMMRMM